MAAYIQGPILGAIERDLQHLKTKLDLRSAYFVEGHDAYEFTNGNMVGLSCVIISLELLPFSLFTATAKAHQSPMFLLTTGSGFTAIFGSLLSY